MLFKNPSVLYTLFALLIPIVIHLFKLRKFQKTAFTNVAFLEQIQLQSRKSSLLKKWLVLLSRLFILTAIIFAFAQPYLPPKSNQVLPKNYCFYLDNSFSLQAKGSTGPLLQRAIQDFITHIDKNQKFSLFTNNKTYKNVVIDEIKNDLLDTQYTDTQLTPDQIILKAKQINKNAPNTALVAISDFQKHKGFEYDKLTDFTPHLIQLVPQELKNVAIDSLWLTKQNTELILNINVSANKFNNIASLSIFNKKNLVGKLQADFSKEKNQTLSISLPKNKTIEGIVNINSSTGLNYDNSRYFSVNIPKKINVLCIGSNAPFQFLQKIYTNDEFNFSYSKLNQLNYTSIQKANTVILNELENIPTALRQNLFDFTKKGGSLVVIPSQENSELLRDFLSTRYNIKIGEYLKIDKKITDINYTHPLFKNVFTKKATNFQYPTINEGYTLASSLKGIINLEDGTPFLMQKQNIFLFNASLNKQNTNFKQSPLIVPCFYKIAKQDNLEAVINYTIGKPNTYNVTTTEQLKENNVLHLKGVNEQFIPLQRIFDNYVQISTTDLPKTAGNYTVTENNSEPIGLVSYNYHTKESVLEYESLQNTNVTKLNYSTSEFFSKTKAAFEIKEFWKWFLIFALFFIAIEILLLKFLK